MRARVRDEQGTVAIMVALLMVVMCVMAAIVLDFGLAYKNKRQAQTAADAGTLAAASVYNAQGGTCTALVANPILKATAKLEADKLRDANLAGVDPSLSTLQVACNGNGELVIDYSVGKDSEIGLGQLAVDSDHVTVGREAQATLTTGQALQGEGGLRPWPICSNVVTTSETVIFAPTKGGSVASNDPHGEFPCGTEGPPGGWWVTQCTNQSNSTGATEAAVLNGCPTSGYHAAAGQLPTMTPTQLRAQLVGVCPKNTNNDTCLGSDPGNNFSHAKDEWQTLVGHIITMPTLCFPPQCMSQAAVDGSGNTASYAIHQIATVEICGFNMGGVQSTAWPTTGPCKDKNPLDYDPADVTSGDGLFLVIRKLDGGSNPWAGNPTPPLLQLTK